jgi:hypothetical protein
MKQNYIFAGDEKALKSFHDDSDAFLIYLYELLGDAGDKAWAKEHRARTPAQIAKDREEADRSIREKAAARREQLERSRARNAKISQAKGKPGSLRRVWG